MLLDWIRVGYPKKENNFGDNVLRQCLRSQTVQDKPLIYAQNQVQVVEELAISIRIINIHQEVLTSTWSVIRTRHPLRRCSECQQGDFSEVLKQWCVALSCWNGCFPCWVSITGLAAVRTACADVDDAEENGNFPQTFSFDFVCT